MLKMRLLFSVMLALLAVLLLTGCINEDNPVRTSLVVDTSTLTLAVGDLFSFFVAYYPKELAFNRIGFVYGVTSV